MLTQATVEAFIATVVSSHHAEAIERFYAANATMQENHHPPRVGRDVLVAHERAALARHSEALTHPVGFARLKAIVSPFSSSSTSPDTMANASQLMSLRISPGRVRRS